MFFPCDVCAAQPHKHHNTRVRWRLSMAQETASPRKHSNAYNIFILVLTVLSLAVMAVMLLPISDATRQLLSVYDNLICVIFLIDFFLNWRSAPHKSEYFLRQGGWLDLLGSIPSFGLTRYGGLLRLARLGRFARILRLLRGENKKALVKDVLENRSRYALFITILLTILVLTVASTLVLQFESQSPEAKIITGGDALWYALVTITTVGYGDYYPITSAGRITAMFIMFAGVGIIGALASILASLLVGGSSPAEEEAPGTEPALTVEQELTLVKNELAALRQLLENMATENKGRTQ
jgi:voltage-gated potassium channel